MVLVFKTSVSNSKEVEQLSPLLESLVSPEGAWNFDLEDCDKILRIETNHLSSRQVEVQLQKSGFRCNELED